MSKHSKPVSTQCQSASVPAKITRLEVEQKALVTALEKLFAVEGWEIPDDYIAGQFKRRFDQLEARVNHLSREVLALKQEKEGKPASGRVDALAAADAAKKEKK